MITMLKNRDALMQSIRAFFHAEGFVEVETPIRLKTPCMELHIDAEPSGDRFLRTSPELYHKKLLAQGVDKIFEIGKCFRQGERGRLHNPEYTMLEWYRAGGDYVAMLEDTIRILSAAGLSNAPQVFTVAEIFEQYAGWNPVGCFDADRFDLDLIEKIEPALMQMPVVILKDYPAECCALARLKPNNPAVAERWELYLNGLEVANAYSELTDPDEQRMRFKKWAAERKALGKTVYAVDEEFIQSLSLMPPSGGCALGIDRLLLALTGSRDLDDVLVFRD